MWWESVIITAPNGSNQEILIYTAIKTTDIELNEVDYIDAYGIGMSLGGLIEVDTLFSLFKHLREHINIYYRNDL